VYPQIITINGRPCTFESGETILDVATRNGIEIPTICYLKGTTPTGNCGICVVEIEGHLELALSCSTLAKAKMGVQTNSPKVICQRKIVLEQMLSSGNHNCTIGSSGDDAWTQFQMEVESNDDYETLCPAWGECKLQELAYKYQVQGKHTATPARKIPLEMDNPMIIRDTSRCILCGRCVAACNQVQVNRAIAFGKNGDETKIIAGQDDSLMTSDCVFCGECVQVCPVGALVEKKALNAIRPWETTKIRTTCPYCGVGCQQWLHVKKGKIIKVTGVEEGKPNQGRLCVKGRFGYDFIYSKERIRTPLIRENGELRSATWDEALDLVAKKFTQIIKEDGPDALAGVSCARSINEDSYQMQKLFRSVFKTNNIDHCART